MGDGESSIGEVPLGPRGSDRKIPVKALEKKGVHIPPHTISNLRGGWSGTTGKFIKNRLFSSEKLAADDARLKNSLYLNIAKHAIDLRAPQQRYTHRFDTNHYMEGLAEQLGKNQHDVGRLLQAMRADFVSTSPDETNPDLVNKFRSLAEKFIADYSGPYPSSAHPPVKALDVNWDHTTILNFYKVLSSQGARFVTTWVPYEMEAMADFYGRQISQGNHLTPFDKEVLGVILDPKITDDDYAEKVRSESGVLVNQSVVQFHRNCLVYGSPESVIRTRPRAL